MASPLALGGSCHSCYRSWGIHRGLISRSHGGNSLAAGALGIPHMPMGVGVLGQLMCIQPLDLLGDLLPEIFWQSQLRLRNTDI